MGKSLVIVESPAKAKTINKYLGNEYVVKSSIGHIRDLPTSGSASANKEPVKRGKAAAGEVPALSPKEKAKRQLFARMGVDPEHGWKAQYEILPGKEKVVEELRRLAKEADTIYLATDLDREGEAIAWHLRESIGGDDSRYKRVVFNEITKKAIQEAFSKPGELDINRVNAQQARRFLDRVVGYMVSPLLWAKIARGLSAGRVQSVAVKLVVEREKEIRAFVPEEYWEVHADLGTAKGANVRFEVARENGAAFKPLNEAQAMAALDTLKASAYSIAKREDKPTSSKPSAPFITSTLQQAASNRLGFGVKKTMMMAQRLYEAGYITYMRTDSTNLSADAVSMVRDFIEGEFGKKYLPANPIAYSSKEGAQEAHEAIRPSDVNLKPTQLSGMERDAERLYELIWRQFVACQMPPAEYLSTTVTVTAAQFELRAKGRILKFDGYTRVLPQLSKSGEDDVLPDMSQGDVLKLIKLDPSQHFTKPPARYSEASLVKEMEKRGIGRPSTYAAIIGTIQDRGYVALHNRRFYSEKMGDIVTERLGESFSNLMDYGFTAGMEEHLDDVAQGERQWKHVLDDFYGDFKKKLEVAEASDSGMRANLPTPTDIACRECGRHMMIRTASTGVFLGCSGYALPPKERCKSTLNLVPGDEIAADDEGESESRVLLGKHRCPICATAMDAYLLDETRKLHICGNNPDCTGYEVEHGQYRIKGYEGPSLECDKCGSQMQLKTGRFGKFFGCTNSECKNTRKLLKSGEAAPPKMDPVKMPELKCEKVNDTYILRDGASGLFLAASQFPKNRETRAPLVLELVPHKAEIDPKYHFLIDAPQKDPDGLPAVIRYSRKTKEQYVQTEVDGKPTGWKAFFDGGKWKVEDKR
ncbi:MAG: type I DNA topoisomerase [Gammaproteobacteria bacterium]|uniref:DNA topoisomerase 1 n=1 Tax=Pseudomonas cuatrocienegasensis TaxID=543360 RepID=A0ABY1BAM2_9PSED|nr:MULTISPECIES: type I DNA topoisomerase [Pseudomonas]MBU1330200.1 type I DNA topoisomerase [Gammaproteobacteria bacterium]MBU1490125.1 type I DNA topoisomerase [Gammaproteobacteria bacterium]MBU2065501.1 type I DNA topoisomerase [Gammaproteobacteria bacterium]MBU2216957.1 type I DNA topoisomerase [Gammaproteobacteria bacterium]OEC34933.1 DNA topoisomerase I [Pseudomonas sp. 21C1]